MTFLKNKFCRVNERHIPAKKDKPNYDPVVLFNHFYQLEGSK